MIFGQEKLGQMRIIVLARRDVLPYISGMQVGRERTGLLGVHSNKVRPTPN